MADVKHSKFSQELSNGVVRLGLESKPRRGIGQDDAGHRKNAISHQPYFTNSLSSREMDSLTAFCDTLLPSIRVPAAESNNLSTDLLTFYTTSASMAGIPQHFGGFLSDRLKHPSLLSLRLALWLLSTWVGTFILCGRLSLSARFPYFLCFSQVSLEKREKILLSWSSSYFHLLRMLFYAIKSITMFLYFTQVNEKSDNSSWKALGYCGPDQDFASQTPKPTSIVPLPGGPAGQASEDAEEMNIGPLHKGLVNLRLPKEVLADTLKRSGFSVPHTSKGPLTIHCDAVVVGSGSGGGVAAGILAKAGYKVIVLEKGNYFARRELSLLEGPSMDQMYQGSGFVASEDLGVSILAGSTVGGGSTINWSASIKTPQHVIDEWSNSYQLELFQSQLYRDAMGAVCDKMGVQSDIYDDNLANSVIRRGCSELGYPVYDIPRNCPADHSCGWCSLGCKDGKKKSTAETWLVDMVKSGNGVILPGCEVTKVLYAGRKGRKRSTATGVSFKCNNGKEVYLVQSKVTLVAGGALGTPTLLKKSGFKNKNIGKNLHLHPVAMSWGYFPNEEKTSYEGPIMTAMSTIDGNLNGSGYGTVIQTPSLHPGLFSVVTPWASGNDMKERMTRFSKTVHIFALARDKGSGDVKSFSTISYKLDTHDEENLKRGLAKTLRILAAAGAEEIGTNHLKGRKLNVKKASTDEFEKFVKEESGRAIKGLSMPLFSAHQMGSCRMGVDPDTSVVNQIGETWEVEGLFLADSSVLPTALGVNPMVTIQSIAYCTAQSVIEILGRKKSSS